MRVLARGNRGEHLSEEARAISGNTAVSVFHIQIGHVYPVYAMALWPSGLGVLIIDETRKPNWYHLELFDVVGSKAFRDGEFRLVSTGLTGEPVLALWGYQSMIHDDNHHDELIERKIAALSTFLRECDRSDHESIDDRKMESLEELVARSRSGTVPPQ